MYTLQVVGFDSDIHMPTVQTMRNIPKVWIALDSECYDNYIKLLRIVAFSSVGQNNEN